MARNQKITDDVIALLDGAVAVASELGKDARLLAAHELTRILKENYVHRDDHEALRAEVIDLKRRLQRLEEEKKKNHNM